MERMLFFFKFWRYCFTLKHQEWFRFLEEPRKHEGSCKCKPPQRGSASGQLWTMNQINARTFIFWKTITTKPLKTETGEGLEILFSYYCEVGNILAFKWIGHDHTDTWKCDWSWDCRQMLVWHWYAHIQKLSSFLLLVHWSWLCWSGTNWLQTHGTWKYDVWLNTRS